MHVLQRCSKTIGETRHEELGRGTGSSKKAAETAAADDALKKMAPRGEEK
jgi:dsRNA-specific ribonuclease